MDEAQRKEGQARDVDGVREMDEDDNVRGWDEGAPGQASEEDTDNKGLEELVEEDEEDEVEDGTKHRLRRRRAHPSPDYAGQQSVPHGLNKKARTRREHQRAADGNFARARDPDPAQTALRVFKLATPAPSRQWSRAPLVQ
ncbi:uncharacterized protein JCM10292_001830 [Rhodotorula paludigena]|uniref:uncharacterized protein n=1 Tax=Rhodotorula paludigena TaxID=86838 RepID=UPI00316B96B5